MSGCILCKIVEGGVSSDKVYEDADVLAFRDVHPLAPVHMLIIPKKHFASFNDFTEGETELIGKMMMLGRKIAGDLKISEKGYKLLLRTGEDGGQEVGHVHLHLIGGAKLSEVIKPIE